mmetsp:Transcript_7068/g.28726  ORF Transcript_7068/g.28726 Transcript_7068/m.28726 type:complete len:313 (+) Transcript_7068:1165-2103(+)
MRDLLVEDDVVESRAAAAVHEQHGGDEYREGDHGELHRSPFPRLGLHAEQVGDVVGRRNVPHPGARPDRHHGHGRRRREVASHLSLSRRTLVEGTAAPQHGARRKRRRQIPRGHGRRLRHAVQGLHHRVREVVDEHRVGVQRGHPSPLLHAALLGELPVLHVDLLERLDVLRHKRNRHRHHRLRLLLPELPDDIVGVGLEPLHGPDAGLVRQHVLVRDPHLLQSRHDQRHALLHLLLVRVTRRLDVAHRDAVRAEEHDGLVGGVELTVRPVQLRLDQVRHGLHVPGSLVPAGNHRVRHPGCEVLVLAEDLLQ